MSSIQNQHQQFKTLLSSQKWEEVEAFWLDLAEQLPDQPEFLLLLVQDVANAQQAELAGDLASLIAPNLKSAGKLHEWLYALKFQAATKSKDKKLRADLLEAYQQIYQTDPRLKTILSVTEFERPQTPLPAAITRTDRLLALRVGAFCQHKSWGYGRVKAFDINLQRIVLTFPHNPEHSMQFDYAADSLTPIGDEHIEVRKITDLDGLKKLAAEDPLALLRLLLVSENRGATAAQIEANLTGSVIAPGEWKKWWDNARKLLKRNPHFDLPAKKTDPVTLRTAPASAQDELLEAFRSAPALTQKIDVGRELLKQVDDLENADLLAQEFQDGLLEALKKSPASKLPDQIEGAVLVDQLRAHQKTPTESSGPLLQELLGASKNLPDLLEQLSAPTQKRCLATLKTNQPQRLLENLNYFPGKTLDEISDLLPQAADRIEQMVRNQNASAELLGWLCKAVLASDTKANLAWVEPLRSPVLLSAVLNKIESSVYRVAKKLQVLLFEQETLLTDLLVTADTDTVRAVARQILASSAFEELDRRSLMGRLVKEFPFVQEFLVTKTVQEQPLTVSTASYHRRKAELDEIIQKKIPQNSKEIGLARSYGDLRENFEYKAAKDMQRLLMRRRSELERMLARAQPSDLAEARTDSVQIGTTVTVTDLAKNKPQTFHILGAWDSNPDRGIISYPAALAQALLNKRPGDVVEWDGGEGLQRLRIDTVTKVSPDILQSL